MKTIKTMFESYKRPANPRLRIAIGSIIGVAVVAGLGILSFNMFKDQNGVLGRDSSRVASRSEPLRSQPTASLPLHSGINPLSSDTGHSNLAGSKLKVKSKGKLKGKKSRLAKKVKSKSKKRLAKAKNKKGSKLTKGKKYSKKLASKKKNKKKAHRNTKRIAAR